MSLRLCVMTVIVMMMIINDHNNDNGGNDDTDKWSRDNKYENKDSSKKEAKIHEQKQRKWSIIFPFCPSL